MGIIKFVYFDVGGVIIDWIPAFEQIHKRGGKTMDQIQDVFHRYAASGISDKTELLKEFNRELGLSFNEYEDFADFYCQGFSIIPQTHSLIKDLAGKYPLGLFSNTEPLVLETSIKLGRIPDIKFAAILASCYIGHRKPEMEFYEIARKKAGVKHQNILFIDDLERNLIPARSLDWHTVLFDTTHPEESVKKIVDYLVSMR